MRKEACHSQRSSTPSAESALSTLARGSPSTRDWAASIRGDCRWASPHHQKEHGYREGASSLPSSELLFRKIVEKAVGGRFGISPGHSFSGFLEGDETGEGLASLGEDDFFAGVSPVQQFREVRLRVLNVDHGHAANLVHRPYQIKQARAPEQAAPRCASRRRRCPNTRRRIFNTRRRGQKMRRRMSNTRRRCKKYRCRMSNMRRRMSNTRCRCKNYRHRMSKVRRRYKKMRRRIFEVPPPTSEVPSSGKLGKSRQTKPRLRLVYRLEKTLEPKRPFEGIGETVHFVSGDVGLTDAHGASYLWRWETRRWRERHFGSRPRAGPRVVEFDAAVGELAVDSECDF